MGDSLSHLDDLLSVANAGVTQLRGLHTILIRFVWIVKFEINFSLKGIIPSLMQTIFPDFQTLENFAVTTLYIVLSLLTGSHPAWPRGT